MNAKKNQIKKIDSSIKTKVSPKRPSVEYFGMNIDENLNWKQRVHDVVIKSNRANALLFAIRNCVNRCSLRTIYFGIFDTHINYANLI